MPRTAHLTRQQLFEIQRSHAVDVLKNVPECELPYNLWNHAPAPETEADVLQIDKWMQWLVDNTNCKQWIGNYGLPHDSPHTPQRPPDWMLQPPAAPAPAPPPGPPGPPTPPPGPPTPVLTPTPPPTPPPAPPPPAAPTAYPCSAHIAAAGIAAPILDLTFTCLPKAPTTLGITVPQ